MGKVKWLIFGVLFIGVLITGCSSKALLLSDLMDGVNSVEITDRTTGKLVSLNDIQSGKFIDQIKELEFTERNRASNNLDSKYIVELIKEDKISDSFEIIDDDRIKYGKKYYQAKSSGIDLEYVEALFYVSFDAEITEAYDQFLTVLDTRMEEERIADQIYVSLGNGAVILNPDGEEIEANQLKAGDFVTIYFNGTVRESYPPQLDASIVQLIK